MADTWSCRRCGCSWGIAVERRIALGLKPLKLDALVCTPNCALALATDLSERIISADDAAKVVGDGCADKTKRTT